MAAETPIDAEIPDLDGGSGPIHISWPTVAPATSSALEPVGDTRDDELVLPPERVRFTAPLSVDIPDVADGTAGAVVNLSDTGLACVLPAVLHDGERLTCRFRTTLGDEPVVVDAEVVWRRRSAAGDSAYGLRFVSPGADEGARIRAAVRERAEGRAGEWPLPVLPSLPAAAPRRPGLYLTAAIGMAAGAVLSLGLSFLPGAVLGRNAAPATPARQETRSASLTPVLAPGPQDAPAAAADAAPGATAETPASPTPATAPESEGRPADPAAAGSRASAHAAAATPASPATAPAAATRHDGPKPRASPPTPAVATTRPPASGRTPGVAGEAAASTSGAPTATVARTLGQRSSATRLELELATDAKASPPKSFWLEDPRRLVIDVPAAKSGLDAHEYPIAHALASRLRVGNHADRVRFVLDTAEHAVLAGPIEARGNRLIVQLTRR